MNDGEIEDECDGFGVGIDDGFEGGTDEEAEIEGGIDDEFDKIVGEIRDKFGKGTDGLFLFPSVFEEKTAAD